MLTTLITPVSFLVNMKECDKCWGTGKVIDHRRMGREARMRRLSDQTSLKSAASYLKISPAFLSLLERGKRTWTQELWEKASR